MQPALLSEPLRRAGAPLLRLQTDQRLVRLVRAGSHPAFTEIVHRYRPALERYTGRIVGTEQAEDVVQQAFANAHTALMTDDRHVELKPWLYRIVHNAALNVMRSGHEVLALDDHEHELVVPGAEAQAEDRERFRSTLRAVQALPPAQRNALLLRELEGRSHEEIAAALGVSAGAARQHLMRARATMRSVVTAVTPYPAVLKLAALAGDGGGSLAARTVAGGGAGLTLSKLGAGILAAGAVAGGAGVVVPAVVPGSAPKRAEAADRPGTTGAANATRISVAARTDPHGTDAEASARRHGGADDRSRSGSGDDERRSGSTTTAGSRHDGGDGRRADDGHDGGGAGADDGDHGATSGSGRYSGSGDSEHSGSRTSESRRFDSSGTSGSDDSGSGTYGTNGSGDGDVASASSESGDGGSGTSGTGDGSSTTSSGSGDRLPQTASDSGLEDYRGDSGSGGTVSSGSATASIPAAGRLGDAAPAAAVPASGG